MIDISDFILLSIVYMLIGFLVQFLGPLKKEILKEDLLIAVHETHGKISPTKARVYQVTLVTLLAIIWPVALYWIAKDAWRG